jgi:hypothetical protein
MRQYSIDFVEINFFGVDLKPGLAQGSSITEARNAPSWTQKPTGQGRVVRVYNPDRSGTLSVVLDQESAQHQSLRALAATDRVSRNIVGVLTVKDTTSGETFFYRNAYIMTEPDEARGTESGTFTWVFNFEGVEHTISINQNVVGA